MRLGLSAIVAVVLLAALASPAAAQRLETIFAEANAAYFAGDYDAAAAGYERLVSAGVDDADVSFNLATAHAKARRYGQAIRWYERALWLAPGDDDAERGLAVDARGQVTRLPHVLLDQAGELVGTEGLHRHPGFERAEASRELDAVIGEAMLARSDPSVER